MTRTFATLFAAGVVLASPAAAQEGNIGDPGDSTIHAPGDIGAVAMTPSRLERSRIEMNRGRPPLGASASLGRSAALGRAASLVARAGLVCEVIDAAVVGRSRTGEAVIEIDCARGGGVIAVEGDPVQVTDCLDLAPDTGQGGRGRRVIAGCVLPGNTGLSQSARARN